MAERLATQAWKTSEHQNFAQFVLDPDVVYPLSMEKKLQRMLDHAAKVAPGFEVPFASPTTIFTKTANNTAGAFQVDQDGYVSINIDQRFVLDHQAACAILSHEVCHYILVNSGIRESDTRTNERLTDACMFVLGYGELFLNGYKHELAQSEYRQGHKLGYLEDTDYMGLKAFVKELRQPGNKNIELPSEARLLRSKILARLFGDQQKLNRYVRHYQDRHPTLNEMERLERILFDLER